MNWLRSQTAAFRQRCLERLSNALQAAPLAWIVATVILAAVGGWYAATRLEYKTSRNDLISRDSEYWRLFRVYTQEFRAEEDYVILVEGNDPAENMRTVDALVAKLLSNQPDVRGAQQFQSRDIFYRINYDFLKHRFLFFLPPEDLVMIRDSIGDFRQLLTFLQQDPTLVNFYGAMGQMLRQMGATTGKERRDMESFLPTVTAIVQQMRTFDGESDADSLLSPWSTAFFSEEMLGEAQEQLKWRGYTTFRKGKMFLILVHPRGENGNGTPPHPQTIQKLRAMIAEVQAERPNTRIGLTGEPVLDFDEMEASKQDATRAVLIAVALIAALFAYGFREITRPLLGTACVVLALAVTMGYATLTVGHLNLITVTFAVMILGLGIDLGIQLIARYEEELLHHAPANAVRNTLVHTGGPIITAGVTTAAAFFSMGFSGFLGTRELGIIAGGGMLICVVINMTALPCLLLRVRSEAGVKKKTDEKPSPTALERLLIHHHRDALTVIGAVTAVAGVAAFFVKFDYNVLNLQSKKLDSVQTELRLLEADAHSTIFAAVVADDIAQARELHPKLEALPTVATVASLVPLLPEKQEEKIALIQQIQRRLGKIRFSPSASVDVRKLEQQLTGMRARARRLLEDAVVIGEERSVQALQPLVEELEKAQVALAQMSEEQKKKLLTAYQKVFFEQLQAQLDIITQQKIDAPMTLEEIPPELRQMYVGKSGQKFLLQVFPKENIWERDKLVRFVNDVRTVAPNATGTPLGLYEFVEALVVGYEKAAIYAFLVIVLLVLLDFRRWLAALATVLPLILGGVWTIGLMVAAGISFNAANIMTLPLIVGIGVAYGIYVVRRFREDGESHFHRKSTGRAVIFSALTAMAGFGTLMLGTHRGIASLGFVMTGGIAMCLLAALLVLPPFLQWAKEKGWKI
jgi:hopanoid biosynthesis associated RND transporter like protein HpnN